MSPALPVSYRLGTHRLVPPEATLARVWPERDRFGITRLADVTRLDLDLGVPVYMAIRPRGRVFHSSAGKGLTGTAAKVSALMEAVEMDVAERPDPARLRVSSLAELRASGARADALPEWISASGRHLGDGYRVPWTTAEDLVNGGTVWLPAGAAYFCEPSPCRTNTNGLASGNHLVEATLHGLYEVIERDATARMIEGDSVEIERRCLVCDPASATDPAIAPVIAAIGRAETKLVLLRVTSDLAVPVFCAVLLNRRPFAGVSALSMGYGAHLDLGVALARAVCEAVQSRLTMIHGARDDIVTKPVRAAGGDPMEVIETPAYRFFDALSPAASPGGAAFEGDLSSALEEVLSRLRGKGHERVYRVEMPSLVPGISVVKIVAPMLRYRAELL